MKIKLAKLTPRDTDPFLAFADFEIEDLGIKIKGCCIRKTRNGYVVKLPSVPRVKDRKNFPYSPLIFLSKKIADHFFMAAEECVKDTYPQEEWRNGIYSKFNQGLAKR